jgi:hypothetical protein
MKVFRIQNNADEFQYFLPEHDGDWPKLRTNATPRLATWSPPPVYVLYPKLQAGALYNLYPDTMILSPGAMTAIGGYASAAGETLPLPYQGQTYTLLNVLECVNVLDHERTVWQTDPQTGMQLYITKYAFHANRLVSSPIFKIPETSMAETFVLEGQWEPHEEFRAVVERAQLKGMRFEEVWSDEG